MRRDAPFILSEELPLSLMYEGAEVDVGLVERGHIAGEEVGELLFGGALGRGGPAGHGVTEIVLAGEQAEAVYVFVLGVVVEARAELQRVFTECLREVEEGIVVVVVVVVGAEAAGSLRLVEVQAGQAAARDRREESVERRASSRKARGPRAY